MAYRYQGSSNLELADALESALYISATLKKAFLTIPRGEFLPDDVKAEAYFDRPIRLEHLGFNVSAPHMHAFCMQSLNLQPGQSFLDVGCGSGFITAVGGYLVGPTGVSHGIDILDGAIELSHASLERLKNRQMSLTNVTFEKRNVFLPDRANQRWDRIHVGATCPQKHKHQLYDLLNPGGILVVPIKTHLIMATKDIHGFTSEVKLLEVRYGDLVLPTREERHQASLIRGSQISVPISTFCSDFRALFNNRFLSDAKFLVEGRTIFAHKSVLAGRSPYFFSFYNSGFKDSLLEDIQVTDYTYNAFFEFVRFLYTDHCEINDISIAGELIAIAEFYRIEKLKALAEWTLSHSISVETACAILELSSYYHANRLKLLTFEFIISNYESIKETKAFSRMNKEHVVEILTAAMKRLPQAKVGSGLS